MRSEDDGEYVRDFGDDGVDNNCQGDNIVAEHEEDAQGEMWASGFGRDVGHAQERRCSILARTKRRRSVGVSRCMSCGTILFPRLPRRESKLKEKG